MTHSRTALVETPSSWATSFWLLPDERASSTARARNYSGYAGLVRGTWTLLPRALRAKHQGVHETGATPTFLEHAIAFFNQHGIQVRRVLTDNGSGYRGPWFAWRCRLLGIKHTRTKPRHPCTNGRAERFIGTLQDECLYARHLTGEDERERAIAEWLDFYDSRRPHTALGGLSPLAWLQARTVTKVQVEDS